MQQLEQTLYESPRIQGKKQQVYFNLGDLESLSASVLYTGDLPPMGPGGFGFSQGVDSYGAVPPIFTKDGRAVSGDSPALYEPAKIQPLPDLTVRDLPASGFQLHIHEEAGGYTHFTHLTNGEKSYSEINSYDAAMADGGPSAYEGLSTAERIAKIICPHGLFGADRKD